MLRVNYVRPLLRGLTTLVTSVRFFGLLFLMIGLAGTIKGDVSYPRFICSEVILLHQTLATEFVGLGLTLFVLDILYAKRDNKRLRAQLFRQINSTDNGLALLALEELKANRWIRKRYTREVFKFREANLRAGDFEQLDLRRSHFYRCDFYDADFRFADLEGAGFWECNFQQAHFEGARFTNTHFTRCDFRDAEVADAQFATASGLWGSIMTDGERYDGRFELKSDMELIAASSLDMTDQEMMERFYSYDGPMDETFRIVVLGEKYKPRE